MEQMCAPFAGGAYSDEGQQLVLYHYVLHLGTADLCPEGNLKLCTSGVESLFKVELFNLCNCLLYRHSRLN